MDIKKIQHFINLSQEDFADSHEPVNDGIKEVPNADDIAAQVGRTSDGGADITKDAVTPEPKESEVSEEPEAVEETDKSEVVATTDEADKTELAHDNIKAVDADTKVTTSDKEALENFVPKVKRAELIGYSKRDTVALTDSMRRIRAKAGVKGSFVISSESINESIVLADAHLTRLNKTKVALVKRQVVSSESHVGEVVPLAHADSQPVAPEVAEALTLQELQPVIDSVIEEQAMAEVYSNIQTLETAGHAVEGFTTLLRENNGRISKQAAAIIHASLEHIDHTCSLRVRTTGLEDYNTSPRAAMESTDVDEKSLSNRAAEIGAKIIKFLKMLWDKAEDLYKKYSTGVLTLEKNAEILLGKVKAIKEQSDATRFTLPTVNNTMFMGSQFVGTAITKEEENVIKDMTTTAKRILGIGIGPAVAAMTHGALDDETYGEVTKITQQLTHGEMVIDLPGGYSYNREGITVKYENGTSDDTPESVDVPLLSKNELVKSIESIRNYLSTLASTTVMDVLRKSNRTLSKGVGDFRGKVKGNAEFDEQGFQGFQNEIIDKLVKPFDLPKYVTITTSLARMVGPRLVVLNAIYEQHAAKASKGDK